MSQMTTAVDLQEAARQCGTGRTRLCRYLRDEEILFKAGNNGCMPKQRYIDKGHFIVKLLSTHEDPVTKQIYLSTKTLVTPGRLVAAG